MFEDFSFSTPSRRPGDRDRDEGFRLQCDSNLVSPLSSRCPSPGLLSPSSSRDYPRLGSKRRSHSQFRHTGPAPTSVPMSYVDHHHRLSVGSLTHRLHAHTLESNAETDDAMSITPSPCSPQAELEDMNGLSPDTPTITTTTTTWQRRLSREPPTPPDTDRDEEALYASDPSSMSHFSLSRNPSLSLPHQTSYSRPTPRSHPDIRQHRETLSILQSTASTVADTIRLAVLLNDKLVEDEHHPSSLPPSRSSSRRRPQHSRYPPPLTPSSSSSSSGSHSSKLGPTSRKARIDKSHYQNSSTGGNGGGGGGHHTSIFTGRGHGLRRRSLVLAAVSAVLEAEVESASVGRRQSSANGLLSPRSSPDAYPQPRRRSYGLSPTTRLG